MFLYLDESGDLGWRFAKGGRASSSRFLTLAFMLVPADRKQLPKRTIKKMYETYKWDPSLEVKGSELSHRQKLHFCALAKKLVQNCPDIHL